MTHLRLWICLVFLSLSLSTAFSQYPNEVIKYLPLWQGPAPQSNGTADQDTPKVVFFQPKQSATPTPAIVICPGGAYQFLASTQEGTNVARWYRNQGVAAFVLYYRLPSKGYYYPVPLLDVQRAIRLVRSHASEWNIDPAKVGVMGFSAGGHLASTVETHYDAGNADAPDPIDHLSCRPDFAVLVYPVISMKDGITHKGTKFNILNMGPGGTKPPSDPSLVDTLSNDTQVTPQTPPTVIVVASDDDLVKPINSHLMYDALQKAGVPSALQEYPKGGHGFAYGMVPDKSPPGWLDRVGEWLKTQGFMPDSYTPAPPPAAPDASTNAAPSSPDAASTPTPTPTPAQ